MAFSRNLIWPPERVERLKELWPAGHSAAWIAREIGGITRMAVIGKVHRMGLGARATRVGFRAATAPRPLKAKKERIVPLPLPPTSGSELTDLPPEPSIEQAKTLADKGARECSWPVGDDLFCASPVKPGAKANYCPHHLQRAYQPPKPARKINEGWGQDSGAPSNSDFGVG